MGRSGERGPAVNAEEQRRFASEHNPMMTAVRFMCAKIGIVTTPRGLM